LEEAGLTSFSRDVLGVGAYTADTGVQNIVGSPTDPIGNGINTALDYTAHEDFVKELVGIPADASDILVVATNSNPILLSGSSVVGARSPRTGVDRPGRAVYLTFPLDAVPLGGGIGNNRAGLMRNILSFLAPTEGSSTLTLDRNVYTVPSLATVEVEDLDMAGRGTNVVRGFGPAQPGGVQFTLTETTRRGLFRGTVSLEPPGQPAGGPALIVQSGQSFRVEYADLSAGQTQTVDASVETQAPTIASVAHDVGYTEALITWSTSEPADGLVQYSDSPLSFPINFTAYDGNLSQDHELVIGRLQPETTYYYRIISRDLAGNVVIDDNNGQLHTFVTLRPEYLPWQEKGESGAEAWNIVTIDEGQLGWELGEPANGASAPSPMNVWATSLRGDVADIAESVLLSPGIYLSGGSKITLRFLQNYDFIPSDNSEGFEYGTVELYTNLNTAPIPVAVTSDSSFGEWEVMEVDLSAYREQLVYLSWHYVLFSFDSQPRLGWMIDDIEITATNIPTGTLTVSNNLWQARFVMSGPSGRSGSGSSLVLTNARPGTYQITFGDVPYYQTPPVQTNTLTASGHISFQGNYGMLDANRNGMADAWEQAAFGQVSPTRTALSDTDGDGFPDLAEFIAGTDPNQPTSTLHLSHPVKLVNGAVRLQWPTVRGRAYRVQVSSTPGQWQNVTDWMLATSSALSHSLPPTTATGVSFFRVEVAP
jgi:hypothetical protein